jgi:hypothetical protein
LGELDFMGQYIIELINWKISISKQSGRTF